MELVLEQQGSYRAEGGGGLQGLGWSSREARVRVRPCRVFLLGDLWQQGLGLGFWLPLRLHHVLLPLRQLMPLQLIRLDIVLDVGYEAGWVLDMANISDGPGTLANLREPQGTSGNLGEP